MQELKPVACADNGILNWYAGSYISHEVDLYYLPDTHRIVSVELLRHLTGHGDKMQTFDAWVEAQAIIDKEQSCN